MMASSLLFACAGEKLELKVKASMSGQPAAQAKVAVDKEEQGATDENGAFTKVIRKKPGADVEVVVSKEMPGYHIKPWKGAFVMKLSKSGAMDTYSFTADLAAAQFVTLIVTEKGSPVQGAAVLAAGKEVGKTDGSGRFVYEYKDLPDSGIDLAVHKPGYAAWHKSGSVEPGQTIEARLSKRVTVTINALVDEYGQASGIPGISVSINNREAGKTDAKGALTWSYDGEPGKKVPLTLSAPGYLPESWKTTIVLEGEVNVNRYFYPLAPKPIRTGIYRFVSNTPNADLREVLDQTESAVAAQLFKYSCFREVPSKTLQQDMKHAKLNIDKITAKGWRETPLRKTVDMIILGSVAKDEKGLLIETKFYTSGGTLILSQITRAKSAGDINGSAKEIANAVIEQFPFEGTVVSVDGERYRINLGKSGYKISHGTDFTLMTRRMDERGKISGYRETGRLRVRKSEENGSWAEVDDLKKDEKIALGDRVVRRIYREGEEESARNYFVLLAKGGLPPDVSPLASVNIYVNDEWLGSTGPDGKAEVPVRLDKNFNLVLYRHGYQQVTEKVKIEKNRDAREFTLLVNNALFKIDSQPSGADVFVDGDKIGRTPILDGKPVNLGFHTVKVSLSGDYRDWEEVVEFAKKEENRTGSAKIVLYRDFLKIGERAEQRGDIDGAIAAYKSTEKGHPDYSVAHQRLAQLYLDETGDYDGAIREFENVLAMPENQQLVYKQFSVTFMNLGHAYYEKGNALLQTDREAAAKNFAKAIQNLQIAKQNTRFFPNDHYDEAVHDTYYYTALSFHKLYQITRKTNILNNANLAWREYFDFFPKGLEGNGAFEQAQESARKYWDQIKNL
jgi:tetratricopeptide (TPR) repeat protein